MKRILMIAAALASLAFAAAPSTSQAATSVGVSVHIGDPYRGASFHFRSEPAVVLIPSSRVYYVDDYDGYDNGYDGDIYRYGGMWYLIDDGYWYQARSYRGPFIHISFRSVPRAVYSVPTRYRRDWGGSYANYGGRWDWYRNTDRRTYSTPARSYPTRDRSYTTRDRSYTTRDRSYQTRDQNVRYRDNVSSQSRNRSRDGSRTDVSRDESQVRDQNQSRGQDGNSNGSRGNGNNGRAKGNKGGNGHGNGRGGK